MTDGGDLLRVESAVRATAEGNLSWEHWAHDCVLALGMAGRRNPLGFAVVRYLSEAPGSANTWEVIVQLASALIRAGQSARHANEMAWQALEFWKDSRCRACAGRGVLNIEQRGCTVCGGSGRRRIDHLPSAVKMGVEKLMEAENWMEGQLAARLKGRSA